MNNLLNLLQATRHCCVSKRFPVIAGLLIGHFFFNNAMGDQIENIAKYFKAGKGKHKLKKNKANINYSSQEE